VKEALPAPDSGLCALGRGVPGCWRCVSMDHLRRDCPQPPSEAEQKGMPLNAWAKQPGSRSVAPTKTAGMAMSFPPRGTMAPATTNVAQMATLTARVDRQEAMFETVLERLSSTLVPTTSLGVETTSVPGAAAGVDLSAPTPLMQAPLVIGGVHPEGYIYVGMNHGLSVWGHADVVAASVTDLTSEQGNV